MAGPHLELLAPAKNAAFGMAAIDHGADAVYIGGPAFGARASAGNAMADIARLTAYAHRFNARVFVTLNTILRDDELEPARQAAWQAWDAGADALIVQDMGVLDMDLPPIQLHASTQCDIRSAAKARFLEQVGFSQIVLARELDLAQIREVAAATGATLEFFIHGAICVAYSGQCYISHAHTGRSANRGECSQACRLPYTLTDPQGRIVAHEKHLLSMKDNDQSANLRALIDAGIRSFKIEGRLKDLSYVKNITAHYRQLLDAILEDHPDLRRASTGRSTYTFEPRPEKTFNRGATDYFVQGRQEDIGAFDSPKFSGEVVGSVTALGPDWLEMDGAVKLNNGDGLSWYDSHGELAGLRVSLTRGSRIFPNAMPEDLPLGTTMMRNRDQAFERLLEKRSAERRIAVDLQLAREKGSLRLLLQDEDGICAQADLPLPADTARDAPRAEAALRDGLAKLGNTDFVARNVTLDLTALPFLTAAQINGLRRDAIAALAIARQQAYPRPLRALAAEPPAPYPESELTYLGNVFNAGARAFYQRHGVQLIADAYEANQEKGLVSLMITRHCLRYSFHLCPKQVKGIKPEPMTLHNGREKLLLRFDCKPCEMHVMGKMKKHRTVTLTPIAG